MNIKMELPRRLLVGLSGGADSVALASLLMQKQAEGLCQVCAVHVNHGLRAEQSDADEAFVRKLCQDWQLPLMVYRAQPPEHPGEDWARQARYGFFREAMEAFQAEAIALAHHRDDQAETFLLHLLRGAGSTGLGGMAQDSHVLGVRVIRPLLENSRQDLQAWLMQRGIPWREDDSNQDRRYLRNALRHDLLPLMEQLAPGAGERMAHTAQLLREDDLALHHMAQAWLREHGQRHCLPLQPLQQLPKAVLHRVLRQWWQNAAPEADQRGLTYQQTEALAQLLPQGTGSKCNLPGGCHGYRGWSHLHLMGCTHEAPEVRLTTDEAAHMPGDGKLTQAIPRQLLAQCQVRTREKGDWIRPYGMAGKQSLQDYFINRRVDAPFRDHIPLLCRGSEVLLAAGVGAGAIPPMDKDTDTILIRWQGLMPWAQA